MWLCSMCSPNSSLADSDMLCCNSLVTNLFLILGRLGAVRAVGVVHAVAAVDAVGAVRVVGDYGMTKPGNDIMHSCRRHTL